MCGVTKLCGAFTSGSEIDGGSLRSTSRPTARMRPLSSAAFNAGSSTSVPRATLMKIAPRFIEASAVAPMRFSFAGVAGIQSTT